MRTLLTLALVAALVGCKKDEPAPAPEPAPGTGEPAPGTDGTEAAEPTAATDQTGEAPTEQTEPGDDLGQPPAESPKAEAAIEPEPLPEPPEDNILLVARRAATSCRVDEPRCEAVLELASKIQAAPDQAKQILETGTDQDKAAVRAALLHTTDPAVDELLVSGLVTRAGALNPKVVDRVVALRTKAAVEPLVEYLAKASASQARATIDALGRLGLPEAGEALIKALQEDRLAPFWGEICQAASRTITTAAGTRVGEIGRRLGATPRQAEGCRSAEAALRMLQSAGGMVINIGPRRIDDPKVLVHQLRRDPSRLRVTFTGQNATCTDLGESPIQMLVPLGRDGEPVTGAGLTPRMVFEGKDLGTEGVYLFRFDAIELEPDAPVKGAVFATQAVPGSPRIVVSGPFDGTYCGVTQKEQ